MLHRDIQTITNITKAIANPAAGDVIFLDLDGTLLLTGFKKFSDAPKLTEAGLPAEILRLQERGIRVVGLTARSLKKSQATLDQLKLAGIQLEVIHAPDIKHDDGSKYSGKGRALREYLITLRASKRIFVFDNLRSHLEAIKAECEGLRIPLFLKHYVVPDFQPVHIDADSHHLFPEKLDGFQKLKSLGGGTASVFTIKHPEREQPLVLKLGAHEDGAKVEMLCNAVYRILGVNVPKMRVYHTLPKKLAASLGLKHPYRFSQLCEFIQSGDAAPAEIIKKAARDHFVAHALLGNIDVAKKDNFIVDKDMKAYLIDAGANFIFRSLGQMRKEASSLISEIETLRDKSFNDKGPQWFGDLTDDEIRLQLKDILSRQHELTDAVWTLSQQMQLPDELRDKFLQCLSDRLDALVTRYIRQPQAQAKVDKRAQEGKTAAGILTYTIHDGEPCVLLSRRVRHDWWDNFGGKSEAGDENLLTTARREVAEESGQLLNYTDFELLNSPFHDLVTGKRQREQQLYRMYLSEYDYIHPGKFKDNEHTAHQWVPLKDIIAAVDARQIQQFEGQDTVVVKAGQELLPLYPPLFTMLQQQPVRESLAELLRHGKMKRRHTLGYESLDEAASQAIVYRPLATPIERRQQIAAAMEKKSRVIREFKRQREVEIVAESRLKPNKTDSSLTQSEIHLKAILGKDYHDDDLSGNVRRFIENHLHIYPILHKPANRERLAQYAVTLIENEKKGGEDNIYFYHACSNSIAFAYDVYTAIYQALQQDARWSAFRPDSEHFQRFLSINEFIAHYSDHGKRKINNNEKNYNDCAISANVFLFGNHTTDTSCSVNYLMINDVRRQVDLSALFMELLQPFQVSAAEVKRLLSIFSQHLGQQSGSLYQIAMPVEQAKLMSYPAGYMGVVKDLDGSSELSAVLQKLREHSGNHDAAATEYISHLQARVMLPPSLPLTTSEVRWKEMTVAALLDYRSALTRVVNGVVHKILCHHSVLSGSNPRMPLVKVLPQLLRDNQLAYSSTVSDAVLLKAILSDDVDTLRRILNLYPELLQRKIGIPGKYIEHDGVCEHDQLNPSTVRELILQRSAIPLDVIIDFTDDAWAAKFTASRVMTMTDLRSYLTRIPVEHSLALVTQNLPLLDSVAHIESVVVRLADNQRIQFAYQNILLIKSLSAVHAVSTQLPKPERLSFLRAHMQNAVDLCEYLALSPVAEQLALANRHMDMVTSGHELGDVVSCCASPLQLPLAILHRNKIADASQLFSVIMRLPNDDKLEFALLEQQKLKTAADVANLLKLIHGGSHTILLDNHLDKILNSDDLICILRSLNINYCEQFLMAHQDKIKAGDQLDAFMNYVSSADRLAFATRHQGSIITGKMLVSIAGMLDPLDRMEFVCRHAALITDFSIVKEILYRLHPYSVEKFVRIHQDKIGNAFDFCTALSILPKDDRVKFAIDNYRRFNFSSGYKEILEKLPDYEQQLAFVMSCDNFMNTYQNYLVVTQMFKPEDQIKIMTANLHSADILTALLNLTPLEQRLALAIQYHEKIHTGEELVKVTNVLDPDEKLSFVVLRHNLITQPAVLLPIINMLPPADALTLAKAKRQLITSESLLNNVYCVLPVNDRDAFLVENIPDYMTLGFAMSKLPAADRAAVLYRHLDLVTNRHEMLEILTALPASQRLRFATLKRDMVDDGDTLCGVLHVLQAAERCVFIEEMDISEYSREQMIAAMDWLPEDACLAYISARITNINSLLCALEVSPKEGWHALISSHLQLIDAGNLEAILPYLPSDQRLDFAKNYLAGITSTYKLIGITAALKIEDRFQFAMLCKDQLYSCGSPGTLLRCLPEDKRLLMAQALLGKIDNEYDLTNMAEELPAAEKLLFVLDNMRNRVDFLFALNLIDISERLQFANSFSHLIAYEWEFAAIIELLPAADRLAFAMAKKDFFKANMGFYDTLRILTADEALIFATANQEKITSAVLMDYVCGRIPTASSYNFLKANIRNADLLVCLLRRSAEPDRLALATRYQDVITDYRELHFVLSALPNDDRLSFAIANQDKPHAEHLGKVADDLYINDRLHFVDANCKDGNDLLVALEMLHPDARLIYAMRQQDKIVSLECLESVDKLVHGDKQQFIAETRARIKKVLNPERAIIPRPTGISQLFTLFCEVRGSLDAIAANIGMNVSRLK